LNTTQPTTFAFVDSAGDLNTSLLKDGTSKIYVATAVIIDASKLDKAINGVEEISRKYFSYGEVKSSLIGSKHRRRSAILRDLVDIPFTYYALIVNKRHFLPDSGLQYKKSAFKFLNRAFYGRFSKGLQYLQIVADEHGGADFMDSFEAYLESQQRIPNQQLQIFDPLRWNHQFCNSKESRLVQLSDLIAGTLFHCFEPSKAGTQSKTHYELLASKMAGIDAWPFVGEPVSSGSVAVANDSDLKIRTIVKNSALELASNLEKSDSGHDQMRYTVLNRLLTLAEHEDTSGRDRLYAKELMCHLDNLGFEVPSEQSFRGTIIGNLRDAGIIISSNNNGFKLATSLSDIEQYLALDVGIIEPMLSRVRKAREKIKSGTGGQIDILASPTFSKLKKIVEAFQLSTLAAIVGLDFEDNDQDVRYA